MQADTDLAMLMLESSSNASEAASRLDAIRASAEAAKQVHCTVWCTQSGSCMQGIVPLQFADLGSGWVWKDSNPRLILSAQAPLPQHVFHSFLLPSSLLSVCTLSNSDFLSTSMSRSLFMRNQKSVQGFSMLDGTPNCTAEQVQSDVLRM